MILRAASTFRAMYVELPKLRSELAEIMVQMHSSTRLQGECDDKCHSKSCANEHCPVSFCANQLVPHQIKARASQEPP